MPPIRKYKKIKRPKVAVTRKTLKRPSYNNLVARYVSLRRNNTALARALNQQREENQDLFRENINLTAQLQDLRVFNERYMEAFAVIAKNSRLAMDLMVDATGKVVESIATCNNFHQPEPSRLMATRESSRRTSTNRSPARGVVQPMVSGHAIAQPAIALSRIRIAVAPNISNIEEGNESTSGSSAARNSPRSIVPARPVNRQPMVPSLPQRIRLSSPGTDNERRSSEDSIRLSSRSSSRYQKRKSRNSTRRSSLLNETPHNSINSSFESILRSPRVALRDVSRLMQNSQSINLRRLMDSSQDILRDELSSQDYQNVSSQDDHTVSLQDNQAASSQDELNTSFRDHRNVSSQDDDNRSSQVSTSPQANDSDKSPSSRRSSDNNSPEFQINNQPSKIQNRRKRQGKKLRKSSNTCNDNSFTQSTNSGISKDDPLEGTSWRHNNMQAVITEASTSNANLTNSFGLRGSESENFDQTIRKSAGIRKVRMSLTMLHPRDDSSDDDDGEHCQIIKMPQQKKTNSDEETTNFTSLFARNVCTSRGITDDIDSDEFTMMQPPKKTFKPWTMADLDIPNIAPDALEQPLIITTDLVPEPETTRTIQIIKGPQQQVVEQAFDGLPDITINTSVTMPMLDNAGRESEDDTTVIFPRKRRTPEPIVESSSESEATTPKKIVKSRNRAKTVKKRDPRSAKVVLEKIQTPEERKRNSSPNPSRSHSYVSSRKPGFSGNSMTSDSESSNASFIGARPRRHKAPQSLAEPSLRKKLRRG